MKIKPKTMKKELNYLVRKSEEKKGATANEERKDIFKTAADSYTTVSKVWEKSYRTLYKPWLESTENCLRRRQNSQKKPPHRSIRNFMMSG